MTLFTLGVKKIKGATPKKNGDFDGKGKEGFAGTQK